jgi:hypothetical protein
MEVTKVLRLKNPSSTWKLGKTIKIKMPSMDKIIEFNCVIDERGEDYFYSKEANYMYHKRLFNKKMLVEFEEKVFTPKEIGDKILLELYDLEMKKEKIISNILKINKASEYKNNKNNKDSIKNIELKKEKANI